MIRQKGKTVLILTVFLAVFLMCSVYSFAVAEDPQLTATETEALPACAESGEHQFENAVMSSPGRHILKCRLCGTEVEQDCEFAQPPVYRNNEDGSHSEFCLLCGGERKSECVFSEETVAPTQTEAGYTVFTCTLCGYTCQADETKPEAERDESGLLGDIDGSGKVEANDARSILRAVVSLEAIEAGRIAYADLDRDGELTAGDARLALRASVGLEKPARHAFVSKVQKKASCTAAGELSCSCEYCGETGTVTIPAAGHRYKKIERIPPTCTKAGKERSRCSVCGFEKNVTLAAPGHRWETTEQPPTCTEDGSEISVCTACGKKEIVPIPAVGHEYSEVTENHPPVCRLCGDVQTGWVADGEKYRYFEENGKPVKNRIVEDRFVDSTGIRCDDPVITAAVAYVNAHSDAAQTPAERLKSCYRYLYSHHTYKNPHGTATPDGPAIAEFAKNMFNTKVGNCFAFASSLCYIAHVLGFESRVEVGRITAAAGGMTPHGFTGIKTNGKWYVCDAMMQWQRNYVNCYMVRDSAFPYTHSVSYYVTLATKNGEVLFTKTTAN